jgi:hypothetical protein
MCFAGFSGVLQGLLLLGLAKEAAKASVDIDEDYADVHASAGLGGVHVGDIADTATTCHLLKSAGKKIDLEFSSFCCHPFTAEANHNKLRG